MSLRSKGAVAMFHAYMPHMLLGYKPGDLKAGLKDYDKIINQKKLKEGRDMLKQALKDEADARTIENVTREAGRAAAIFLQELLGLQQ